MAYEGFAGNRHDSTTLQEIIEAMSKKHGKANRVWVLDRGLSTEATLEAMRNEGMAYLLGTPRSLLSKLEKDLADRPWEELHDGVQVKLLPRESGFYVSAAAWIVRTKK